jgi:hypothetical protein
MVCHRNPNNCQCLWTTNDHCEKSACVPGDFSEWCILRSKAMSLEFIEFVCGFEPLFGVELSDRDLESIKTPAELIDLLWPRIPHGADTGCLSQKAFYRLRRVLCQIPDVDKRVITPNVLFADISSSSVIRNALVREFDAADFPNLARKRKFFCIRVIGLGIRTVAEAITYVVAERPFQLKPKSDGWSRREVAEVVKARTTLDLAVTYLSENSRFSEDLGVTDW